MHAQRSTPSYSAASAALHLMARRFDQRATLQPGPVLEASVEQKSCCREKYVETQLAKRLGRTDAAADAAPLDAQQRAEQELYGVPDNLKARRPAYSFVKAGEKCNYANQGKCRS